jgi:Secretion system C-terminal sorting domain
MKGSTKITVSLLLLFLTATWLPAQIDLCGVRNPSGFAEVLRWDALTGTISSTVPTTETMVYAGASVFDASRGYYYFAGVNSLQQVSFSPDTINALPSTVLITSGEVSMSSGKIYGLHSINTYSTTGVFTGSTLTFQEYNPMTMVGNQLLTIPNVQGVLGDGSAYNSNAGIYHFLGIDSTIGLCLYSIATEAFPLGYVRKPITNPMVLMQSLEYDNDNDALYAIGNTYNSNWNLTNLQIHRIDTATGGVTTEADLTAYNGYVFTSNSYDQSTHTMVVMAVTPNGAFQFLGWDTQADSLRLLQHPLGNVIEIEADNTVYAQLKYQGATSTAAATLDQSIVAFPNPAQDRLTLRLPKTDAPTQLAVFNAIGTQVMLLTTDQGEVQLDVSRLPAGHYFVRAVAEGHVAQTRFVVAGGR